MGGQPGRKSEEMKKLDPKDFDRVYEIMDQSFPRDEIRPHEGQKKLLDIPEYQLFVAEDEGEVIAFLATWDFDEFVFLEHFAVDTSKRNAGVGSQLLQEVIQHFGKMACLEVELPDCEISVRRIHFYERNGFKYLHKSGEEEKQYYRICDNEITTRLMYFDLKVS